MLSNKFILHLSDITPTDKHLVGSDILYLATLKESGFNVSDGFVLTTNFFDHFLKSNKLDQKINTILNLQNNTDPQDKLLKSLEVKRLIEESHFPKDLENELLTSFLSLGSGSLIAKDVYGHKVEIQGESNLAEFIKSHYKRQFDPDYTKKPYLLIQKKLPATNFVEIHSFDTNTLDKTKVIFKSESDIKIIDRINPGDVNAFVETFLQLERHYFFPLKAKFELVKGLIYLTDISPLTFVSPKESIKRPELESTKTNEAKNVFRGIPTSPGRKTAPVRLGKPLSHGDILYVEETNNTLLVEMHKASAIITRKGHKHSHAAVFAKKRGIPSLVIEDITLKNGQVITVDGITGEVIT